MIYTPIINKLFINKVVVTPIVIIHCSHFNRWYTAVIKTQYNTTKVLINIIYYNNVMIVIMLKLRIIIIIKSILMNFMIIISLLSVIIGKCNI